MGILWLTDFFSTLMCDILLYFQIYLSGHISVGADADGDHHFYDGYNERMLALLEEYGDVIVAGFFGHDHRDQLQVHLPEKTGSILILPQVDFICITLVSI